MLPTGDAGERLPGTACYCGEDGTPGAKPTLLLPAPGSHPALGYSCLAHPLLLWDILTALRFLPAGADHFPGEQWIPGHGLASAPPHPEHFLVLFSSLGTVLLCHEKTATIWMQRRNSSCGKLTLNLVWDSFGKIYSGGNLESVRIPQSLSAGDLGAVCGK